MNRIWDGEWPKDIEGKAIKVTNHALDLGKFGRMKPPPVGTKLYIAGICECGCNLLRVTPDRPQDWITVLHPDEFKFISSKRFCILKAK